MLDTGFSEGEKLVFMAFAAIFGLGFMAMMEIESRMHSSKRERIMASPERVRVERSGFLVSGSFDSSARDVLRVGIERLTAEERSPHVIMIESRDGAFHFGEQLSPEERRWLTAAIRRLLARAQNLFA